jgi:hypothetical protein
MHANSADVGGNNVPATGGEYNPDGLTVAEVLGTATPAPAADAQDRREQRRLPRRPTRTPPRQRRLPRQPMRTPPRQRRLFRQPMRIPPQQRRPLGSRIRMQRQQRLSPRKSRHRPITIRRQRSRLSTHPRSTIRTHDGASLPPHVGIAARGAASSVSDGFGGAGGQPLPDQTAFAAETSRGGRGRDSSAGAGEDEDIPGRLGTIIERQQYRRPAVVALLVLK